MRMKRLRPALGALLLVLALLNVSLVFPSSSASAEAGHGYVIGHVYVLTNAADANTIEVFDRYLDGSLMLDNTVAIGGQGSGSGLGSQGSLVLSPNRHWLFAVDAGSNQVSVVAVGPHGHLTPVSTVASGGVHPVSLTYSSGRLYVVNAGDANTAANIAGFWIDGDGTLNPIPGATQPLSAANPAPAQVQANPTGTVLIVTEKATNTLDSYTIADDGSLSAPTFTPSTGQTPFGFAFRPTHPSQFIVSDAFGGAANAGALTSYRVSATAVQTLDGPVANQQTAPCWVVITNNGRFAYTSNTGSNSVTSYAIGQDGKLTPLASFSTEPGTGPSEMALSPANFYLYVLDSHSAGLSGFYMGWDGHLAPIHGLDTISLPASSVGLAVD